MKTVPHPNCAAFCGHPVEPPVRGSHQAKRLRTLATEKLCSGVTTPVTSIRNSVPLSNRPPADVVP